MKIYLHYKKDSFTFNGFYLDEYNYVIPSPSIIISQRLWEYLRCLTNDFKLKENFELKEIYTLDDKDLFEIIPFEHEKPNPTKIDLLEEQNAYLIKENLKKDIEIKNLNANMAQTTLNLVNKDIQIKGVEKDIANLILKSLGGN